MVDPWFSSQPFMPHGHCYLWTPSLVWLQVISNGLIGLAYVAISASLSYLVFRIKDLPFKLVYSMFGVFIVACGITHFMDVWVIWTPLYWLDGGLRLLTALASVGTAVLLPPLIPRAVALARGAQAAHERGIHLHTAVQDLEALYRKTRELDELKTQFFTNISHELRTPLALILGPAELLAAAPNLTSDQKADLQVILRNARALLQRATDLLDLSKLDASKMRPEYAITDMGSLVTLTAANFEALARQHAIRFTVSASARVSAEIDAEKIRRCLVNLLSNAFKFTPQGGAIHVSLAADADRLRLSVADSGPGVLSVDRAAIFERFVQSTQGPVRGFGGTGLGLAIVKEFAALHRGSIRVDDAEEGGAQFTLDLPRRAPAGATLAPAVPSMGAPVIEPLPAAVPPATQAADVEEGTRPARAAADAPLVLVVEDNPDMNRFLCKTLSPRYRVMQAGDGQQGLQLALAQRPDLIVSDLMMPTMTGEQFLKALRARPDLEVVPFLLLTARADDEVRARLLANGAQDYVTKPFAPAELLARVHNLISAKRTGELLQRTERLASIGLLSAGIAHEINNPLAFVANNLTVLERDVTGIMRVLSVYEAAQDSLATIAPQAAAQAQSLAREIDLPYVRDNFGRLLTRTRAGVDRVTRIVRGLRGLARTEPLALEEIRLPELVEASLEMVYSRLERAGIAVQTDLSAELPIQGVATQLGQVILNLLVNATQAIESTGRPDGCIRISARQQGEQAMIEITDNGRGIPKEILSSIFDPFFTTKPVGEGTGLGLSISHGIITGHGGKIEIESEPDKGCCFRVLLPLNPKRRTP